MKFITLFLGNSLEVLKLTYQTMNMMKNCNIQIFSNSKNNYCTHFLYIIFLLSLIICGLCIFFLGCWLKVTLNNLSDVSTYLSFTVPVSIILLGAFITLSGLAGFLCANHPRWLLLYGYCLLFFFAVLFFICLSVYYYSPDVNESLSNELKSFMATYKPVSRCCNMMDEIQRKFECCGNDQPANWLNTPIGKIPQSCCKIIPCNVEDKKQIYEEGCRMHIKCLIMEKKYLLQTLLFPAAFIPFFGTAITFFYGTQLTRQQYEEVN